MKALVHTPPETSALDCDEGGRPLAGNAPSVTNFAVAEEAREQCSTLGWISVAKRIDVCLIDSEGGVVGEFAVAADADGLRGLVCRVGPVRVRAVIESMSGARFVHDALEQLGWEVLIAGS